MGNLLLIIICCSKIYPAEHFGCGFQQSHAQIGIKILSKVEGQQMSLEIYKNHMSNSWYKFMKRKDCKLASWRMIRNNLFNYSQVSTIKHVKQKH